MDRDIERVLDEYLVVLARTGSRDALQQLAVRWSPRLLRHAIRATGGADGAADIVQETWVSAVRGLRRLEDPARFPAWLYAIATRKCIDQIRANSRGRRLKARLAADPLSGPNRTDGAASVELGLDFAAAMARLPIEQRLAVSLFYGEDLPIEEIAVALGTPVGTVKSRLHHARLALKNHLKGTDP